MHHRDNPHAFASARRQITYSRTKTKSKGRQVRSGRLWPRPKKGQEAEPAPNCDGVRFHSTSARTLKRSPDACTFTTWADKSHWFAGSPQGLSADLVHEGATGASGNTYEPFLGGCVRPDYPLPAYYRGRNLAESFYSGMPFLSWQGVVFGDPLCSIGNLPVVRRLHFISR